MRCCAWRRATTANASIDCSPSRATAAIGCAIRPPPSRCSSVRARSGAMRRCARRRSRAPRRVLVVRASPESNAAVRAHREGITALAVNVLDYTLPEPDGGYETFHAKVVLADATLAYVGSANLLAYARHSMELGILADGKAARVVASVVSAVESSARPFAW